MLSKENTMRFTPRHDFFSLDAGALKRTLLGEGFARDAAFCGIPFGMHLWGCGDPVVSRPRRLTTV